MTPSNFQPVLDHARPDEWFLRCTSLSGGGDYECDWPPEKGTDLAEHLETCGVLPGRYTVEAVRVDKGQQPDAIKAAKTRLRKHGPLSTVVDVGVLSNGVGSASAPRSTSRARTSGGSVTGLSAFMGADVDPSIAAEVQAAQLAAAKAQRVRAEWELEKTERERQTFSRPHGESNPELVYMRAELERLRREQSHPPHALIAALAPVVQALIQTLIDSSTKRDELMLAIFGSHKADDAPSSPTALDAVTGALPLLRQLVELGKELGGGGGESSGMLGDVAQIITALNGSGLAPGFLPQPGPPAPGQPGQPRAQQQTQRLPTAEESMRLNVLKWLAAVQEYAQIGADPYAVAEELYRPLELLPREFRELVTTSNLEAILAALPRWMPRQLYDKLTATMSSKPMQREWLRQFVEALQSGDEESFEPVGPDSTQNAQAAHFAQGSPVGPAHVHNPAAAQELMAGVGHDEVSSLFGDPEVADFGVAEVTPANFIAHADPTAAQPPKPATPGSVPPPSL